MAGKKLVVRTTLQEILAERKLNLGQGYMAKLEACVGELVRLSMVRAVSNRRTTVMGRDL